MEPETDVEWTKRIRERERARQSEIEREIERERETWTERDRGKGRSLYNLLKNKYTEHLVVWAGVSESLETEALIKWLNVHNIIWMWTNNRVLRNSLEAQPLFRSGDGHLDEFDLQWWYATLNTDMKKNAVDDAIEKDKERTSGGGKRKKSKKRKSKRKSNRKKSKKRKTHRKRR